MDRKIERAVLLHEVRIEPWHGAQSVRRRFLKKRTLSAVRHRRLELDDACYRHIADFPLEHSVLPVPFVATLQGTQLRQNRFIYWNSFWRWLWRPTPAAAAAIRSSLSSSGPFSCLWRSAVFSCSLAAISSCRIRSRR